MRREPTGPWPAPVGPATGGRGRELCVPEGPDKLATLRLENAMPPSITSKATPATRITLPVVVLGGDDGGQDEQAHEVHDLHQRVEGGASGVLERVAHGVADDRRLVGIRTLAPVWPSSMYFLALSQAPPVLDRKLAMSWAVRMAAARNAPRARYPMPKPTTTGVSTASRAGVASSRNEASRADVDDTAVLGLLGRSP